MQFWKRVLAGSLGVLGLAAVGQAQTGNGVAARPSQQRPARPMQPDTYGTLMTSYYNVDAFDLQLYNSATQLAFIGYDLYSSTSVGTPFVAALHLPSGARIVSLELDYYDLSSVDQAQAVLVICTYAGQSCSFGYLSSDPTCDYSVCSGVTDAKGWNYSFVDLTGAAITVDNYAFRYLIRAGSSGNDGNTAVSRIQIGYQLQVSPGPATATFSDVPTSHPFFKFVEALHAAGITNGYPDGRFGVNDPITRGQMAVFLSAALGLNWP